jgi:hypothetical protein
MRKLFIAVLAVTSLGVFSDAMAKGVNICDEILTKCNNRCITIKDTDAQYECWHQCDYADNQCVANGGPLVARTRGNIGTSVSAPLGTGTPGSGTNVKGPATTSGSAVMSTTFGTAASTSTLGKSSSKTSGPVSIATKPLPAISATIGGATMGGSRNGGRVNMQAK